MAITRIGGANAISGSITSSNLPSGSVLQTIQSTNSYYHRMQTSSYTYLLSASGTTYETAITPSSTSNKILVTTCLMLRSGRLAAEARFSIKQLSAIGGASVQDLFFAPGSKATLGHYDYGTSGSIPNQIIAYNYLWSPNTTSECKVSFQGALNDASAFLDFNNNSMSTVTLTEIKG